MAGITINTVNVATTIIILTIIPTMVAVINHIDITNLKLDTTNRNPGTTNRSLGIINRNLGIINLAIKIKAVIVQHLDTQAPIIEVADVIHTVITTTAISNQY